MKKSARVSEKLVSPGLPGLHVATRLAHEVSYVLHDFVPSHEFANRQIKNSHRYL